MLRPVLVLAVTCAMVPGCKSKGSAGDSPAVITTEDRRAADALIDRRWVSLGVRKDWLTLDVRNVIHVAKAYPARGMANEVMPNLGSRWEHEGGDIGLGLRFSTARLVGGMTTCSTSALVFEHRIAEIQTVCSGSDDSWPKIEDALVEASAGRATPGPHRLTFFFRDEDLDARALAAVARELGPTAAVEVPPALAASYDELRSPLTELVFGTSCYEGGEAPAGRADIRELVHAGRFDLVGNVARGPNPGGRVYAAEALLERKGELSGDDAATIAKIRALPLQITTCAGCGGGREATAAQLLPTDRR